MELPNSQTPIKQERAWFQVKPRTGKRSSRCIRSQKIPDWSLQELLVLVNEIAAIETDFTKTLSCYQKWKLISDNCTTLGVSRSLNQCRRQWECLLDEYRMIKDWEFQSGVSYWSSHSETLKVALSFDRELFLFIDDNINPQADQPDTDTDSDPDFKLMRVDSGIKKKRRFQEVKKQEQEQEQAVTLTLTDEVIKEQEQMGVKLREQAEVIHAVLKEAGGDAARRRRQASELIKVLATLVGSIEQLSNSVHKGTCVQKKGVLE